MRTPTPASLVVCGLLLVALPVTAQEAHPPAQGAEPGSGRPWYAGITVAAVSRPATSEYHYSTLLGGTTPAVIASAGVRVLPFVTAGGELAVCGALSRVVEFNHFLHFSDVVSLREVMTSVFVGFPLVAGRVTVEPLFAFGVAFASTRFSQHVDYRGGSSVPDERYGDVYPLWGPGINLVVRSGPRVSINGFARIYSVRRNQDIASVGYFDGVSNRTFMAGAGIRFALGR